MLKLKTNTNILAYIITAGLVIRLAFIFFGATIYYGKGAEFINNDSFSFSTSFLNLIKYGVYSFDLTHPDAFYGRLPGYPIFWGLHYLLLGPKYVYAGVAITQSILDSAAIFFIFKIALEFSKNIKASLITAFIYAFYPFIIVWVPITGTELLASFLTVFFFYWLLCKTPTAKNILITGVVISTAFYVREYLAVLIISAFIYYFSYFPKKASFIKASFLITSVFTILYVVWPIRNYVSTGRLVLLKTKTSGYHRYGEDVVSARAWLYSWTHNADAYLDSIANPAFKLKLPDHAFANNNEKQLAYITIDRARSCGSGFYMWRHNKPNLTSPNCNIEIEKNFDYLRNSYKEKFPIKYYFAVPLKNLKKSFFKEKLTNKSESIIYKLLFTYRSVLHILVIVGFCFYYKNKKTYPVIFFVSFIYIFICFFIRQVEMRYLLQADAVLLLGFSLLAKKLSSLINTNNVTKKVVA